MDSHQLPRNGGIKKAAVKVVQALVCDGSSAGWQPVICQHNSMYHLLHKLKMIRKRTLVGRSILLLRNSLWHDHQVVLTGFVNMLSTSAKNWVYCITSMLAVLGTT